MTTIIDTTKANDVAKLNGSTPHPMVGGSVSEQVTFPSSDVTVTITRISQQRVIDHRNSMRRLDEAKGVVPQPPVQSIDIAGEVVSQPNPADPVYLKMLSEYTSTFDVKEFDWFIAKTLVVDTEVVRAYREVSRNIDGTDYAEHPDWYIYLYHIACLNTEDFNLFYSIATSISRPTPAAIADAKDRFRR